MTRRRNNKIGYVEIPGFDGYFINKRGEVLSSRKCKTYSVLTPKIDNKGYVSYKLRANGEYKYRYASRLTYIAFKEPNLPEHKIVVFKDKDKYNTHLDNLTTKTRHVVRG